jgi:hypothetical protein
MAARKSTPIRRARRSQTPVGRAIPVRVRMYRQGLGDCFLLTFDPDGTPVHMLIDCGTLGATTTGVRMAEVVANIRKTTNDHLRSPCS